MLRIKRKIIEEVISHGRTEAPLEACGYLAEKEGLICSQVAMKNTDGSPIHYAMDPQEQFAAVRKCREAGLTIKAVYHTHPETAAYPSAEDIRLAYDPDLSYVIISLAGSEPDVRSFCIQNNKVVEEQIQIIGAQK